MSKKNPGTPEKVQFPVFSVPKVQWSGNGVGDGAYFN
jgi:hypothetical protein